MGGACEKAQEVRSHETDEADDAEMGHHERGRQRGRSQEDEAEPLFVHAEERRPPFSEGQGVQLPPPPPGGKRYGGRADPGGARRRHGGAGKSPHEPKDDGRHALFRDGLEECHSRGKDGAHHDARQDEVHGRIASGSPGEGEGEGKGEGGTAKGCGGYPDAAEEDAEGSPRAAPAAMPSVCRVPRADCPAAPGERRPRRREPPQTRWPPEDGEADGAHHQGLLLWQGCCIGEGIQEREHCSGRDVHGAREESPGAHQEEAEKEECSEPQGAPPAGCLQSGHAVEGVVTGRKGAALGMFGTGTGAGGVFR
jgi:hypothetical protein